MQRILMPVLSLLGLVLLCLFCVRCHAPRIEAELIDQGRERLALAGFDAPRGDASSAPLRGNVVLEVDGRDAVLTGWASSEADRGAARRIVGEVPGMRVVDNRLSLPGVVRFALDRSGDVVALSGFLPSESQREKIVARAGELWGAETSASELQVDPTAVAPEWLGGLPDALTAVSRRTEGGSLVIDDGELTLDGRMFAESTRQALLGRLGRLLPGLAIADRFEVRPPATTVELQATLDAAVRSRTVEFASGSAELTDLGRSVLDEIFELLSSQASTRIAISGHTDDQGADDFNLILSRRRAEAARDYLVAKGLAVSRFDTSGLGETKPIADNATPEGRLKNRRLEFAVSE